MAGEKPTSWWMTLPGVLTALGALITAVTGLVLGLSQIGVFNTSSSDSSSSVVARDDAPSAPSGSPSKSSNPPATLPAGARAYEATLPLKEKMRSGDTTYEILGYETRPDSDGNVALSLSIRLTNHGRFDANFWDASFRVSLGEDTLAPSGGLNELVAGDATKVGTILFVVPDTTRTAELKIKFQADTRTIPFELQPVQS